ncbi:MAG: TolC family protein [Vicinamibacterales bacterium]
MFITFNRLVPSACVLAALVAGPVCASAQTGAEQARINEIARVAAQQFEVARVSAAAAQTGQLAPVPTTTFPLSVNEATARALERNLDIAVERLNPQTFDLQISRLNAAYRPTLTSAFGSRSQVNPPTSTLNGGTRVNQETTTYNSGLTQALRQTGANLSFSFNNNKQVTSNNLVNYNPSFQNSFTLTAVQPLLRNFRVDANRQQLRITTINREVSEIQLRGTIATTLASVRNAYWELVYALQALEVARGSLQLAEKLVEDNRSRVEVGTLAPLDVVQSEAEAATRRQTLAQAEATWRTSELTLKRLIVNGTDDPVWGASINPTDQPTFSSEPLNVEAAVKQALTNRTDLEQGRNTLSGNDFTLSYMRNQTLPALDLTATYGAQGLGGTQFIRSGTGVNAQVVGTVPGGYADAFRALSARDFPNWNVQFNLTYPIGGGAADASYARARVQRNQSAAQLRALELQVATEVTNAALQVQSSLQRYQAATVARGLAQQRLDAEQSRFDVGLSTNFFVVQAQRDLSTAQNSELRALLDYRRAMVDYERVQQSPATRGANITTITGN